MDRTFSIRSILFSLSKVSIYAANHKEDKVRINSSSGGAFYALANYVLSKKGVVIGAAYEKNGTDVSHIIINNKNDLWKLQKSKYAPSSMAGIHIKELVKHENLVLFSGVPCQIQGIKKLFKNHIPDNLILMEVACHGIPTRKSYQEFIQSNKISKIDFRCKRDGWKESLIEMSHTDGSITYQKSTENEFYKKFISGENLRKSCLSCQSKYFQSGADFTLSDFWGVNEFAPELNDNKGTSLVFLHTRKARCIWNVIKCQFVTQKVKLLQAIKWNPNIVRPIQSEPTLLEAIDNWKIQAKQWVYKIVKE